MHDAPEPEQQKFILAATIHGDPNDSDLLAGLWASDIEDATIVRREDSSLHADFDAPSDAPVVRVVHVVLSGTMPASRGVGPSEVMTKFYTRSHGGLVLSQHLVVDGQVYFD